MSKETLEINNIKKKKNSVRYTDEYKLAVVQAVREQGFSVSEAAKHFEVSEPAIYSWLSQAKNKRGTKIEPIAATVKRQQKKAKTPSSVGNINTSAGVSFCPCCGTNIKAVVIALETYKTLGI